MHATYENDLISGIRASSRKANQHDGRNMSTCHARNKNNTVSGIRQGKAWLQVACRQHKMVEIDLSSLRYIYNV